MEGVVAEEEEETVEEEVVEEVEVEEKEEEEAKEEAERAEVNAKDDASLELSRNPGLRRGQATTTLIVLMQCCLLQTEE
jgi:hypothetical protein